MLRNNFLIQRKGHVVGRNLPSQFALIKSRNGQMYTFNYEMEFLWQKIKDGITFKELMIALGVNMNSTEKHNEFAKFLEQLSFLGLIELVGIEKPKFNNDSELVGEYCQTIRYQEYCTYHNIIYSALIELTNHCNLHCIHCYHDEETFTLSTSNLLKILAKLKEMGTMEIIYSGGEVFLRKDVLDLLRQTVQMGFIVNLITNGTLMTEEHLEQLREIDFCIIKTSLYGASADVHDQVTGAKGSFQKTVKMIKAVSNFGRKVMINYMVLQQNVHQITEVQKLAASLGAEIIFDHKIFPTRKNSNHPMKSFVKKEKLAKLFNNNYVPPLTELNCFAGRNKVRIDSRGNIYPCEYLNLVIGNALTESLHEIWYSKKMKIFRKKIKGYLPAKCNTCKLKEKCLRCPALVWNTDLYSNEHHPIMCYQAEAANASN